jgi:SOS response regulatory protein OraA/RecX
LKTLTELAKKKEREVKSKNPKDKNQKIGMFLLSKGYESELIWKILKNKNE